ncbi:hypothetical protein [Streptomyces sp. NBC_01207]|uniref:hypothetical protein n=1 Tax=Streptomyces sp. NBC_01207 TaxID=2903772 RepID=UPI002E139CDB|nr:hypothetical protein OG457_47165 [Streptomyces sp. NBC_01207]
MTEDHVGSGCGAPESEERSSTGDAEEPDHGRGIRVNQREGGVGLQDCCSGFEEGVQSGTVAEGHVREVGFEAARPADQGVIESALQERDGRQVVPRP